MDDTGEKRSIQGYYSHRVRFDKAHDMFARTDLSNLLDEEMAESIKSLPSYWREHVTIILPCLKPYGIQDIAKLKHKAIENKAKAQFDKLDTSAIYYHSTSGEEINEFVLNLY